MHKVIVTLSALLFSVTGCSFTLSSYGGWGSEGPAPLVASRGHGDRVGHGFGKPARHTANADPPRTAAKKPAITWAGEAPKKAKKPAITWAGEAPKKAKKPAITWAGGAPKKKAKQPAIRWAGKVPPRAQ